ncbi:MAG: SDR family oxidoreductase [Alphaproteobacteria bacterium]|nr:SDR family oxidoreductase [Alphaproteobacteria bacterium]
MRFAGKTVLITGAAGVYGRELSAAFAAEGARLFLTDKRAPELAAAVAALGLPADRIGSFAGDLTRDDVLPAFLAAALAGGCPDIVVNNAGYYPFVPLLEVDSDEFRKMIAVNMRMPFQLMQGIGKAMIKAGVKGSFINVSSAAAEVVRSNGVVYGAAKCGLEYITRAFAAEFAPHGIRVNAARPGFAEGGAGVKFPEGYGAAIAARIPMGRTIRRGEFAKVVMFLASEDASFVTGSVLDSGGGGAINRRTGDAVKAGS